MSRRAAPIGEQGMILVNVLMFVAIASGLVLLMISREEMALDRSTRLRQASLAMAIVRGGESSAITALARDQEIASDVDDGTEPWAAISDTGASIEGGVFDLAIADAQGRFNLNNLHKPEPADAILYADIAAAAGLSEQQRDLVAAYIAGKGPITDLRPLTLAGLDPSVAARLEQMVTALPGRTPINLNAAPAELLSVLFHDPAVGQRLAVLRRQNGFLTRKDLAEAGQSPPQLTGFSSMSFWVHTRATIGETVQQGASLIQRRRRADGTTETVTVARWLNAAVPPEAPAFVSARQGS